MQSIHISLSAEKIGEIAGFPITNTLLMSFIATLILSVFAFFIFKNIKIVPSRLQTVGELAVGEIYSYTSSTLENEKLARKYFPLIVTIFLFVLISNIIQFIPGVGSIGFHHLVNGKEVFEPLFRSANTDLNVTLALAIISFLFIEIAGISQLGFLSYFKKFFNFKSILGFVIGIIDLFSELARLISFSFRLFGNIFAGEVIIAVIIFFVPVILPVPLMLFEVFVAVIQAAIFSLLTLFFIKIAVTEHH
ncbi:MAG: F0F1 ATP synthase subunit A [Patescibacteria group bacterium]